MKLFLLSVIIAATFLLKISFASSSVSASSASSRVDVFVRGEGPYYCIKIPYLFSTQKGTLIALAEARYNSCSDFTATDLVMKKSDDSGKTWSQLEIFYGNSSLDKNISNVIGNAAPVQIAKTGRILIPFCRNNLEVFQMHSDDDGQTWHGPFAVPSAVNPDWRWIGLGPPGAIQLMSGRLVAPCYYSFWPHWTDGTDTRAFLLLNDDPNGAPTGWRIGAIAPGFQWTNENQAAELNANHILVGARGELDMRIQIESFDGGETLQYPYFNGVPNALGGCEGSTIFHRRFNTLFYSGVGSTDPARYNMTLWMAPIEKYFQNGSTQIAPWRLLKTVDPNRTAYSSLVVLKDNLSVGLLYERSNLTDFIFLPTSISFEVVWP